MPAVCTLCGGALVAGVNSAFCSATCERTWAELETLKLIQRREEIVKLALLDPVPGRAADELAGLLDQIEELADSAKLELVRDRAGMPVDVVVGGAL